jgi:hypothetical protein
VTAKEKLLERVTRLTEAEADETLRLLEVWRKGGAVDEWGDLDAQSDALFADSMSELAKEERDAGLGPWRRESSS